ncbi:immunoglobulin-like domain-containing protein [Nakamurella deserti]|uniref:immunoglobulin-like domain-containing protein n=1 Tax=Nakamurella deserti TaxID=2164074 RepID=UPI000DBE27D5|nr:immunoglobulin-like domain-containing protein [Nakamurella deserti]
MTLARTAVSAVTTILVGAGLIVVPIGGGAPAVAAPTAAVVDSETLLHYDFSKITGTTVVDSSPAGRNGTLVGTGATVSGDVLTLPGGGSASGAAHVAIPTGTFDGRDTLTISAWLKNETGAGNYAAMFFGTTQNLPTQYWLLNPRNPDNRFKSVITDAVSAGSPWTTETGISPSTASRGVAGPTTDNSWGLYTTVIEPTRITGYYNGVRIGTVDTVRTVSDLGTNLVSYIGRSSYPDPFFKGSVKDVVVYPTARTDAQVKDYYFATADPAVVSAALAADAAAIDLGGTRVTADLTLPAVGPKGSAISWASSAPAVIATDGRVIRPASGADVPVTLTATLTLGSGSVTRDFALTVVARSDGAPAVPGAPALSVDGTTVTATWAAPDPGGSAITGYTVTLSTEAGAVVRTARPVATTQRFTGLADGRYRVGVSATNAIGTSAESPTATATVGAQLLARYDFSKINGTSVPDASGNGRNATLVGSGATVSGSELTLPGGASNSGAAHVALPVGMFDNQNTLTISTWLKNGTGAGNYAAMFFGTTQSLPTQYWLLNPANPAGQFKSVLTDGNNAGAPYQTEAGIAPTDAARGIPGPATGTGWGMYTTVIQPGSITGYYNGVSIGTVATTRTVSQFGTGLVGYLGRSSYPDVFYKGGIRDVSVYSSVLGATDIARAYWSGLGDPAAVKAAVDADAAALDLGRTTIAADLTLPRSGPKGSAITWVSSDPASLAADGAVTRPATTDAAVTLTATLELAGQTATRTFAFTVLANTPQKDLQLAADTYDPAIRVVSGNVVLPTALGSVAVSWASSNPAVLDGSGVVARPAADTDVTLTATFTAGGATEVRRYTVKVLAGDAARLGSYIRTGDTDRTDALHLALATGTSTSFTALNNGRPVLYPTGSTKLGSPQLFRKADGTFGVVATVDSNSTSVYLWDSADLTTFTGQRLVPFTDRNVRAASVSIAYDNSIAGYRATFVSLADGRTYQTTSTDLRTFAAPVEVAAVTPPAIGTFPAGAIQASSIGVTRAELDKVTAKYTRPVNSGVKPFGAVDVAAGATYALPSTAEVQYSNGTTTTMGVQWDAADIAAVDTTRAGTYTVDGTVARPSYDDPLIRQRADPDVTLGSDGFYYFTASYPMVGSGDPEGYDRVVVRKAATIAGLATAPEITIWDEKDSPLNRYIWAPELQQINGTWYVFYTASIDNGPFSIRPVMLRLDGTDPTDPTKWRELGRMKAAAGDPVAFSNFSLDMTYFENDGKHYVIWAEKPGASTLRMAEIDPANPQQLISGSILLTAPEFAWERDAGQAIDEGPAVLQRDGKIYVTFSAATVDANYTVGLLTADSATDLLDPASWTKSSYPLLQTADLVNEQGPGHNSFTVDQYGNPVIVYHSRTTGEVSGPGDQGDGGLFDPGRHARARTVHFAADGSPILNMTAAEELDDRYRAVQVQVVVTGSTVAPTVTAAVTPAVDGENGWYRTAPTVTLTLAEGAQASVEYSVDSGAWTAYTAPVRVGAQGTHTVAYRATVGGTPVADSGGSVTVTVDTVAPVATATLAGRTVTVAGTDATSGVATLEYQLDGGSWTAYTAPVTVDDRAHTLVARATDRAGAVSGSVTLTVPAATAPDRAVASLTSNAVPTADGWYNQLVLVTLQVPANAKAQYRIDGGTWITYGRSFTVSGSRVHTVDTRLLRSGVVVPGSGSATVIRIDTQVPASRATRNPVNGNGSPRNPVDLTFTATDAVSGVARTEYKIDGGDWAAAGPLRLATVGSHLVSYRSVDKAGNVETARTLTVTIVADPVTTVKANVGKVAAGGFVTLGVSGYERYDLLAVTLDGTPWATVGSDVNGAARTTLKVPAGTPVGRHTVTVAGSDGQPTASVVLTVTG